MLRCVVERFEDLSHLSSGPEMHPEAGHGAASGQADHAGTHTHTNEHSTTTSTWCRSNQEGWGGGFSPKATCVERLSTFQAGVEILKVVSELLVLSKLHHVVEVLHVLDDRIQLENTSRS